MQSDLERLAAFDAGELEVVGYHMRSPHAGGPRVDVSSDRLYFRALATLREVRTTTLGLFPRYDPERLTEAARLLEEVARGEEDGSFLQLEASFLLGKVRLAQGDLPGARAAFGAVVRGRGRQAEEASEILSALEEG